MLVKCIGNSPSHLNSNREKQAYSRNIHQDEVWLEIGKEYNVFGILFRDREDIPWFFVCEDDDDVYPKPHLGSFFKIINGDLPSGWAFTSNSGNVGDVALLPKRWAEDPYFLEKLIDEEEDALAYFQELVKHSKTAQRGKLG